MVNMIAGEQGGCQELLSTLEAPYRAQFSQRLMNANAPVGGSSRPHNIIGVYSDSPLIFEGYVNLAIPKQQPYTDDYAPAERLRQKCET